MIAKNYISKNIFNKKTTKKLKEDFNKIFNQILADITTSGKTLNVLNKDFIFILEDDMSNDLIRRSLNDRVKVIPILSDQMNLVSVVSDKVISWDTTVHKPWGYYNTLINDNDFLVKKIVIFSKQSISLQLHNHRSEHWIVLEGAASIQIGDDSIKLSKSESTFVPIKKKHRILNDTNEPLIILETQLGENLSENDIVRFEDQYNRDKN